MLPGAIPDPGGLTLDWRDEIKRLMTDGEVRLNEPLREHTSFRIGGPADVFAIPGLRGELRAIVDFAEARHVPWFILGRGTNLLVRDGGVRGLVIKAEPCLRTSERSGQAILAGAGLALAELANQAAAHSLAGLAFAAGIPGTVGGGVYMNAGAYGGDLGQMLESVTAYYPGLGVRTWPRAELGLGYRMSRFQQETAIIEEARFQLATGEERAIREEMACYAQRRQEKQPLSFPSAGSVFRRPPGGYAGTMIEAAGLKGARIGGAQVSELHANFLVNLGGATAADVLALIALVQREVQAQTGIPLEPEIRVIGED